MQIIGIGKPTAIHLYPHTTRYGIDVEPAKNNAQTGFECLVYKSIGLQLT